MMNSSQPSTRRSKRQRLLSSQASSSSSTSSTAGPEDHPSPSDTAVDTASAQTDASGEEEKEEEDKRKSKASLEPKLLIFYSPGRRMPDNLATPEFQDARIEIRIEIKHLTRNNPEIQRREVWGGNPFYTDDSDPVGILAHTGRIQLRSTPPTGCVGVSLMFRIHPSPTVEQGGFRGSLRHGFRSRDWTGEYQGAALEFLELRTIDSRPAFRSKTPIAAGEGQS